MTPFFYLTILFILVGCAFLSYALWPVVAWLVVGLFGLFVDKRKKE